MYLSEYHDPNLGGFFKSIKKAVKKVTKPIEKVAKKVVKPALHVGAAYLTGGASLAVSAQMLAAKKAKKNAEAAAAQEQQQIDQLTKAATAPRLTPKTTKTAPPRLVPPASTQVSVAPVAPVVPVATIAPAAATVSHAQPAPTIPVNVYAPSHAPERREREQRPAPSAMPPWAIPAAVLAVGGLAVVAMRGGGRGGR